MRLQGIRVRQRQRAGATDADISRRSSVYQRLAVRRMQRWKRPVRVLWQDNRQRLSRLPGGGAQSSSGRIVGIATRTDVTAAASEKALLRRGGQLRPSLPKPDAQDVGYELETQSRPTFTSAPDDGVMVHELAHQWVGDSVSISSWPDIWLNEGFAGYTEWLWSEHDGGPTADELFTENYDGIPADDFDAIVVPAKMIGPDPA